MSVTNERDPATCYQWMQSQFQRVKVTRKVMNSKLESQIRWKRWTTTRRLRITRTAIVLCESRNKPIWIANRPYGECIIYSEISNQHLSCNTSARYERTRFPFFTLISDFLSESFVRCGWHRLRTPIRNLHADTLTCHASRSYIFTRFKLENDLWFLSRQITPSCSNLLERGFLSEFMTHCLSWCATSFIQGPMCTSIGPRDSHLSWADKIRDDLTTRSLTGHTHSEKRLEVQRITWDDISNHQGSHRCFGLRDFRM